MASISLQPCKKRSTRSMKIVSFEQVEKSEWDTFCEASPEAWARHTSEFITFSQTLGAKGRDASFALKKEGKIVGIVPLTVQQESEPAECVFAVGGMAVPFPALVAGLSEEERREAYAAIFREIDDRAHTLGVSLVRMFVDPLTDPVLAEQYRANPLLDFGFTDTSIKTSSVDLRISEDELLSRIQSRQRRYIRAALTAGYTVEFFDEKNITDEACTAFEKLYEKAAGRTVGTPERWRLTWDMVQKGLHMVLLLRALGETEYCAGHIVMTYKGKAYDSMSAIAPSHRDIRGIGALMHFELFLFLKERGFSRFEIGWILPTVPEGAYTKKELDISHFKSLFGGELLPFWRGEKHFG